MIAVYLFLLFILQNPCLTLSSHFTLENALVVCPNSLAKSLLQSVLTSLPSTARDVKEHDKDCISVKLSGSGFHRRITYWQTCDLSTLRADFGDGAFRGDTLQTFVVQPLPPGLFADPYELGNLESSGGFRARLVGKLDLEQPASVCEPTALVLEILDPFGGGGADGVRKVEIPLHAKYPAPKASQGFLPKFFGLRHSTPLPVPTLLILRTEHRPSNAPPSPGTRANPAQDAGDHTKERIGERSSVLHVFRNTTGAGTSPGVSVSVPAGDLTHQPLVEWVTALVVLACGGAVGRAALAAFPKP